MSALGGSGTFLQYPHGARWRRARVLHSVSMHSAASEEVKPAEQCKEALPSEQEKARMDDDGCPNIGSPPSVGVPHEREGKDL